MRTTTTEDQYGRSLYHMHLSLTHMWSKEDCVDQMVVSFEKNSLAYGLMEEIVIKPAKVVMPKLKRTTRSCVYLSNEFHVSEVYRSVNCERVSSDLTSRHQ